MSFQRTCGSAPSSVTPCFGSFIAGSCSPGDRTVIGGTTGPLRTGHWLLESVSKHMARGTVRRMAQPAARKPRGNLPAELTSFVGRRRELAAIRSTLSDARLLTLTGAGGVGKTRLALRAGRELSRTLPDGVWLVELQELRNANLLPTAIMTALGMRDQAGRSPVSLLVDYLEDKELLLILDNCEHLLDACSVVVGAILRGTCQASEFWPPAVSRSTATENSSTRCHRSRFPRSLQ